MDQNRVSDRDNKGTDNQVRCVGVWVHVSYRGHTVTKNTFGNIYRRQRSDSEVLTPLTVETATCSGPMSTLVSFQSRAYLKRTIPSLAVISLFVYISYSPTVLRFGVDTESYRDGGQVFQPLNCKRNDDTRYITVDSMKLSEMFQGSSTDPSQGPKVSPESYRPKGRVKLKSLSVLTLLRESSKSSE